MQPLTDRQTTILQYLIRATADGGRPPSQVEIADHFGLYQSGIRKHLLRLAEFGYIDFEMHSARGIRVLASADHLVGDVRIDQLPLVGRIAAGTPLTAAENIEEWVQVNPELFRPRATHLFRVSGRSMLNLGVLDGDIVAIHEDPDATSGIVAAAVPDKKTDDLLLTLKRCKRKGGQVHLLSENDDQASYSPQIYEAGEVQVLGRYVGLIRPEHRR
ncbi:MULTISPECIES: transcriptional repressor LexA [Hydrocarboniphaga]|uniref:transcriptional repressor LexA n=1 Tax=Hydrocarboniphaga TaxID=243627 RepID=UPI000685F9AC|nr:MULTISPECIES: transcriptional repressor LexA [Hydrocarboniphaga]MDZ4077404.1 transcriptional repressor LexA [Hydrocarboniphaga sp.]